MDFFDYFVKCESNCIKPFNNLLKIKLSVYTCKDIVDSIILTKVISN